MLYVKQKRPKRAQYWVSLSLYHPRTWTWTKTKPNISARLSPGPHFPPQGGQEKGPLKSLMYWENIGVNVKMKPLESFPQPQNPCQARRNAPGYTKQPKHTEYRGITNSRQTRFDLSETRGWGV